MLIGSDVSSLFPPGGVGLEDEGLVFADLYGEVEFLSYVVREPYAHRPEIRAEVDGGDEWRAVTGEVDGGATFVGEPQGGEVRLDLAAGEARLHGVRAFACLVVMTGKGIVAPRGASREAVAEGYALDAHDGSAVAAGNGGQHPVRPLDGEVQPGVGVHQPHPEAGDAVAGHGERGVPVVEPPDAEVVRDVVAAVAGGVVPRSGMQVTLGQVARVGGNVPEGATVGQGVCPCNEVVFTRRKAERSHPGTA